MNWEVLALFLIAARFAGKTAMTFLSQAAGLFSLAFAAASVWAAWRVLRRPRLAPEAALPPITVMKPLKGEDRGLYENLASFCAQDYPDFQLLFCVSRQDDPAVLVVERLMKDFPARDIGLVVSSRRIGRNPKISNLANAYPRAKHGLLVISDSDIRVSPDFLRRTAPRFGDPRLGLVTFFYRAAHGRGLWGSLEALAVNAQFLPQALAAAAFGMRFAMGAAIFVRRRAFDAVGGFSRLADHIADDYSLGRAILGAGLELEFSEIVVDSMMEEWSAQDFIRHQIRECRTVRACQPAGYLGSGLLQGFSLLSVNIILFGADPLTLRLLLALGAAKAAAAWIIHRTYEGRRESALPLLLIPLSEWFSFAFWLSGLRSGQVLWRGVLYSIEPDGRLTPPQAA